MGSCLTLENELSEETRAYKAGDFIGKGHPAGEQEGKGTPENLQPCKPLCRVACRLRFYGIEISFQIVSGQLF